VIRDGLGRLISALEDVELVGVAADGAEAVEQCARLRPDVVLMDLDMPRLDGIEATRLIAADQPQTAVVVLTAFSDRPRIMGALEAGACGYLLKDVDAEEVGEGIRAARARRVAARSARRAHDPRRPLGARPARRSSAREREVLALLVEGLPDKLIARQTSEETVKSHLTRIFRELDVTDRTQAALWAERHRVAGGGG